MSPGGSELRRLATPEAVAQAAAELVRDAAREALGARGRFSLALAGGSTPRRAYRVLGSPAFAGAIDWSRVELFWGDERAVPPGHPDSNFRMARESLLDPLGLLETPEGAARVHRLEGERQDLEGSARDYQATLARVLGAVPGGPPPRLDLVLLGLGPDGHTASLFPGTRALEERERWVVANRVEALGATRLTLTLPVFERARAVAFLVEGAGKAEALARVLGAAPPVLPAGLVAPAEGRLVWLVDEGAAAGLAPGPTAGRPAGPACPGARGGLRCPGDPGR